MMRLARISLAVALALLICTPVMAQPGGGGGGRRAPGGFGGFGFGPGGRGISERMLARLNLTTEQMDAAKAAIAKHAEKIKDLTAKSRPSQEEMTALREEIQKIDRTGKTPQELREAVEAARKKVLPKEKLQAAEDLAKERAAELADVKKAIGEEKAKELDKLLQAPFGKGAPGAKEGKGGGRRGKKAEA